MVKKFWQTADQTAIKELMIAQESLLEAHHGSDEIYDEQYEKLHKEALAKYSQTYSPEEAEKKAHDFADTRANELANQGAKTIFLLNEGILRLGNIEMKSLFKPALGSRRPYESSRPAC